MRQIKYFVLLLFLLPYYTTSADFFPEGDDRSLYPPPPPHDRVRRFVRIHFVSRKPHPEAKEESGIGFFGHIMNLLKGGTLGIRFSLADRYNLYKWKKALGGFFRKREGREMEDYRNIINPTVSSREEA